MSPESNHPLSVPRPRSVLSVVLPTKDRGPEIERTLEALAAQDHGAFEVVIIDNLSCAEDAARLRRRAEVDPRFRYVREERLGLNNARNRGIAEARGEILAFLDDDAVPSPRWLSRIARAFAERPEVLALGGRIVSRFTSPPPDWLDDRLRCFLSDFDRGDQAITLHYDDYPRGANMAFRRQVFERCGVFAECLDRKGESLLSYGDIEMCYRVERAGGEVIYAPDCEVEHLIRGDRLTPSWFARRFHWQGRSLAVFERMHRGRLHLLRKLPYRLVRCVAGGDAYARAHHRGMVVGTLGALLSGGRR